MTPERIAELRSVGLMGMTEALNEIERLNSENARLAAVLVRIGDTQILRGDNPWEAIHLATQAVITSTAIRDLLAPTIELLSMLAENKGEAYSNHMRLKGELSRLKAIVEKGNK